MPDDFLSQMQSAQDADAGAAPAAPPAGGDFLSGLAEAQKADANTPVSPVYSGSIIPASRYSDGTVGFDSNAGVVGMAKRAIGSAYSAATLPGDVLTGQVDPNSPEAIARSTQLATLAVPDASLASSRAAMTPPTAEELHAAADAGYTAARNLGVNYSTPHVAAMATSVQDKLNGQGIIPELAPITHSILDKLQNVPDGDSYVPFSNLDAARRAFRAAGKNYSNPTDQLAAKTAQNAIDDFVTKPDSASVLSGPADQAASLITEARANAAAGFRSDRINQRGDYAEYKANDSNSGQNLSNNLRKQASWFLDPTHPERTAGFSDAEISALADVNAGSPTRNAARIAGNLLGGGLGAHGAYAAVVGATGGHEAAGLPGAIVGAATPLLGVTAKKVDQALTGRAFNKADELVRQRSPLSQKQAANAPMVTSAQPAKAIASRALAPAIPASSAPSMTPAEAQEYVKSLDPGDTFKRGGSVKQQPSVRDPDATWNRMKYIVYGATRKKH